MIMYQAVIATPREEAAPAAPVRLQGRMTPKGYEPENKAWKAFLTFPDKRLGTRADGSPRLAGRDPLKLPPETLAKAGHPNRSTRALVRALGNPNNQYAGNEEGDPVEALSEIRAYRDIPPYCEGCAGDARLRRKCAVINCPFWGYRMGRNPHSPKRGIRPTFSSVGSRTCREAEAGATYASASLQ